MRKKVLVWCMVFVMFLMPSVVTNAEEMTDSDAQTEQEADQSELEGTKAFLKSDPEGNRYWITGTPSKQLNFAQAETTFAVNYYYGGTDADILRVNGYTKSCNVYVEAHLSDGRKESFSKNLECVKGFKGISPSKSIFIPPRIYQKSPTTSLSIFSLPVLKSPSP